MRRVLTAIGGPRRGDIWWAEVPFADGTGAKLRPCLVVRGGLRPLVLKITSRDKSRRRDHVRIPTAGWDPWARRDSYLNLAEPIRVARGAFQRRAGRADPVVLELVTRPGRTGGRPGRRTPGSRPRRR
jgi:hypothetical protein